jgi:hypothetical protein
MIWAYGRSCDAVDLIFFCVRFVRFLFLSESVSAQNLFPQTDEEQITRLTVCLPSGTTSRRADERKPKTDTGTGTGTGTGRPSPKPNRTGTGTGIAFPTI